MHGVKKPNDTINGTEWVQELLKKVDLPMDTEIYQEGNQTMILVDEAKTTDSREEVMNKSIQFYK